MIVPSLSRFKESLQVSEASLRVIRKTERERLLQEEADKRHAQQDLNNQPK